ncbi:MAG: hypothetical protein ONB16_03860 [candidate division KSB1 bacterium]|nr:hypothetical protein [candidate division KSB1 bacterium]
MVKDIISLIGTSVTIIGGFVAATIAIYNLILNRKIREKELRFKQAQMGKQIIEEMFDDEAAGNALLMIDFERRSFDVGSRKKLMITQNDVVRSLDPEMQDEDRRSIFIRECFDGLFYYLDRFEHFIKIGLITFEDVAVPLQYYATIMSKQKSVYMNYITLTQFERALIFLNRFSAWKNVKIKESHQ